MHDKKEVGRVSETERFEVECARACILAPSSRAHTSPPLLPRRRWPQPRKLTSEGPEKFPFRADEEGRG